MELGKLEASVERVNNLTFDLDNSMKKPFLQNISSLCTVNAIFSSFTRCKCFRGNWVYQHGVCAFKKRNFNPTNISEINSTFL